MIKLKENSVELSGKRYIFDSKGKLKIDFRNGKIFNKVYLRIVNDEGTEEEERSIELEVSLAELIDAVDIARKVFRM